MNNLDQWLTREEERAHDECSECGTRYEAGTLCPQCRCAEEYAWCVHCDSNRPQRQGLCDHAEWHYDCPDHPQQQCGALYARKGCEMCAEAKQLELREVARRLGK